MTELSHVGEAGDVRMVEVFRDAYAELVKLGALPADTSPPLVGVDAKLGKKTRAEPVAMRSQQHRLHLVGRFQRLEDQLTSFTSWESNRESPDRLDAMVHAARHHMLNERKRAKIVDPYTQAVQIRNQRFDDGLGVGFDLRFFA